MKFGFSWQIFVEVPSIKSRGSRDDMRTDGQTNNLIPFHSKRALVLVFNVACNHKTCWGLHVNCPKFLPDSNDTWIFLTHFRKSPLSNCMEICPLVAALIHADGQTGVQKNERNEANRRFPRPCEHAQILYLWQKCVKLSSKNCCYWSFPPGPLEWQNVTSNT